jgi:hypothetical protein
MEGPLLVHGEREGEKGVSPRGCISLFPLPSLAPNPLLKTLAASTGRRRCSPQGGADLEGLGQFDLHWRVPGSMVTGSSSTHLQVCLPISPHPSVYSLACPPSSPTTARGRRRGGKNRRHEEEEKMKISPSPI